MLIRRQSPLTGKAAEWDLPVTPEQIARWKAGELAQEAFPHLTADEREFIMSGITPEEWNRFVEEPA